MKFSALLLMCVSGWPILTPVLGIISDTFGTQIVAIGVIAFVWLYMIWMIM